MTNKIRILAAFLVAICVSPLTAEAGTERVLEPSPQNLQAANYCKSFSRIPGGGYCLDWYFGCLKEALGDGNFARLPIPTDAGFYNQMCFMTKNKPTDLSPKRI